MLGFGKGEESCTLDRIDNYYGHVEANMVLSCLKCNITRKTGNIYAYTEKLRDSSFRFKYKNFLMCINSDKEKDLVDMMRSKGVVGGLSMPFHRYHEVNQTKIQHSEFRGWVGDILKYKIGKESGIVKYIASLDANSLYPWAYMYDMPCGRAKKVEGKKKDLIKKIMNDDLYGFVNCSLKVTETKEAYNKYIGFPPFPVTKDITVEEEVTINGTIQVVETQTTKLTTYMNCEDV